MEGASYTEVFAWGGDTYGQLGLANNKRRTNYCVPRYCSYSIMIRQIACGEDHTAFISSDGQVYTIGSNQDGKLGIGDRTVKYSSSPCLVEGIQCTAVECGWGHTVTIGENSDLYAWGVGEFGALGTGGTETCWVPTKMNTNVSGVQISCGSRHTAIVDRNGRIHTCGSGDAGQLGTGRREKELSLTPVQFSGRATNVACGIFHTLFCTDQGKVFGMGGNTFGQLGLGTKKSHSTPVQVMELDTIFVKKVAAGHHSAAVTDTGALYMWGTGVFGEFYTPQKIESLNTIVTDVSLGGGFGAAIDANGLVWTWGSNAAGELGIGDYEPRPSPFPIIALQGKTVTMISCGGSYCMALGRDIVAPPKPNYNDTAFNSMLQSEVASQADFSCLQTAKSPTAHMLSDATADKLQMLQLKYDELKRENMREIDRRIEIEKQLSEACSRNQQLWDDFKTKEDQVELLRSQADRVVELESSQIQLEGKVRDFEDISKAKMNQDDRVRSLEVSMQDQELTIQALRTDLSGERANSTLVCRQRDDLRAQVESLEADLANERASLQTLSRQKDEMQTDLERARDETKMSLERSKEEMQTSLERELTSERQNGMLLSQQNEDLHARLATLEADLEAERVNATQISRQRDEVRAQAVSLKSQLSGESTTCQLVTRQSEDLREQLQKLQAQYTTEKYAWELSSEETSTRLRTLQNEYDISAGECSALRKEREQIAGTLSALTAENQAQAKEISDLRMAEEKQRAAASAASKEVSAIQAEIQAVRNDADRLAAEKREVEHARAELQNALSQAKSSIDMLLGEKAKLAKERDELEAMLYNEQESARKLAADLNSTMAAKARGEEMAAIQLDRSEADQNEISRLHGQVKQAQEETIAVTQELQRAQQAVHIAQDETTQVRLELSRLQKLHESTSSEMVASKSELVKLQTELREAQLHHDADIREAAIRSEASVREKQIHYDSELTQAKIEANTAFTNLETIKQYNKELLAQSDEQIQTIERLSEILTEFELEREKNDKEMKNMKANNFKLFKSLEKAMAEKARAHAERMQDTLDSGGLHAQQPTMKPPFEIPQRTSSPFTATVTAASRSRSRSPDYISRGSIGQVNFAVSPRLSDGGSSFNIGQSSFAARQQARQKGDRVTSPDELRSSFDPPPNRLSLLSETQRKISMSAQKVQKERPASQRRERNRDKENEARANRLTDLKSKLKGLKANKAELENKMRNI